ncbi:hypothetical protein UlMin_025152 [Ulmus minor]
MIILAWNCRGLGQPSAIRDLIALVRDSNPDVLILMETKIVEPVLVLLEVDRFNGGWLVIGDFNGVFYRGDRHGGREETSSSSHMINAVDNLGLVELPSQGLKYTWSNGRGASQEIKAKLDWGIANADWWNLFPNADMKVLPQISSDHSPVVLNSEGCSSFARRPFRFEAIWTRDRRSHWIVEHAWYQFGKVQLHIKATKQALAECQANRNDDDSWERDKDLRCQLDELLRREEMLWFQKAKVQWRLEGDRCSRFFFMTTMIRQKSNRIDCLKLDDGVWIHARNQIGNLFSARFESVFDSPFQPPLVDFSTLVDPIVTEEDNVELLRIPTGEEVRNVVFSMGAFKAPGPDGMTALFYKHYWDIVGWDLVAVVREFFLSNSMAQRLNESFIVLVPKKPNPTRINHYRPISVCNVAYRVITKIIANRLKPLLNRLICPTQNAFILGRSIHDNSVLVQEAIHSMKKKKGFLGWMALKIDLEKAYDRVSWQFINEVLLAYGFDARWLSRGGPPLHHLLFADDIFVFGKACITEASHIKETLDSFCSWSGLSFNSSKSSIFFSGNTRGAVANQLTGFLGFERIPMDSCYLGLPMFRTNKRNYFNFLVECLDSKLAGWKSRLLSKASRLTLIKSVALAMPIYAMHTARIPKAICAKLDARIRRFWWGSKEENARPLCLKAWDDLCVPKAYGGLGLRRMSAMNEAVLAKWGWDLLTGKRSQCLLFLQGKYLRAGSFIYVDAVSTDSVFWKAIIQSRNSILCGACYQIGDGASINIWEDPWVPNCQAFRPQS